MHRKFYKSLMQICLLLSSFQLFAQGYGALWEPESSQANREEGICYKTRKFIPAIVGARVGYWENNEFHEAIIVRRNPDGVVVSEPEGKSITFLKLYKRYDCIEWHGKNYRIGDRVMINVKLKNTEGKDANYKPMGSIEAIYVSYTHTDYGSRIKFTKIKLDDPSDYDSPYFYFRSIF
jgi:hypothetical protein